MSRASGGARRPWRRWILLPLMVLACGGCGQSLRGEPAATPVPVLSVAQIVHQSLVNLAEAGVVHYHGSLVNPNDKTIDIDLSVTATGEAAGSVTTAGQQGAVMMVAGTLYVNAPAQFWSQLAGDPGSQAEAVDSRWVRVPSAALGADLDQVLRPSVFGMALAQQVGDAGGTSLANLPTATVQGVQAVEVGVGDGTVYLAAAQPHGVLRVTVPANLGRARNVSLDVADVSSDEAGIYRSIQRQAQQMQIVVNTDVDIEQGSQTWGTCTAAGCSVVVTFTDAGSVATKVVVQGTWTGDGKPTGTCQVIVGPVGAGRSATATCTNVTPQWTTFYNHAHVTPGQHPYEVDWTAEALAASPDLTALTAETAAAATPAAQGSGAGATYVYEILYQDGASQPQAWKYGVTDNRAWQDYTDAELTACRSVSRTSCSVDLITAAENRPSADALTSTLVTAATKSGGCPPGQWVDCTGSPIR